MAVGSQHWNTWEIKFEELHDLVVVRHQDEHFPEWSVDTFAAVDDNNLFSNEHPPAPQNCHEKKIDNHINYVFGLLQY